MPLVYQSETKSCLYYFKGTFDTYKHLINLINSECLKYL